MSFPSFSNDLFVVTVNGRIITNWGETATPFTDEPIDAKSILRRGQGGNAVRIDRTNPGRRVNLFLNPGSPDSAFMQALFNSNAKIVTTTQQIGTIEAAIGTEGVIVNDASNGRAGSTISDDNYIIEHNTWNAMKGGG